MKAVYCPYCGGRTKRNGRTSSGSQRWRCTACGASTTVRYDDTATRLDEFLGWLLSKDSQVFVSSSGFQLRQRFFSHVARKGFRFGKGVPLSLFGFAS